MDRAGSQVRQCSWEAWRTNGNRLLPRAGLVEFCAGISDFLAVEPHEVAEHFHVTLEYAEHALFLLAAEQQRGSTMSMNQPHNQRGGTVRVLLIGFVVLVTACGGGGSAAAPSEAASPAEPPTPLLIEARDDCVKGKQQAHASIGDEGTSLNVDGEDEYGDGLSIEDTFCILEAVDVPDHVTSRGQHPRDGRDAGRGMGRLLGLMDVSPGRRL